MSEYIIPAVGEENWGRVMALAAEHDGISMPWVCTPGMWGQTPAVLTRLRRLLAERPRGLVAVGECGLDLRSHVPQEGQLEMFEAQIKLAMEHELPLIVHSVRANDTVAKILRRLRPARGASSTPSAVLCSRQRRSGNWDFGSVSAGSSASSGPTRPERLCATCRWNPCCWKPTPPTCRCRVSRGAQHPRQPAENCATAGRFAATTAGPCCLGVT